MSRTALYRRISRDGSGLERGVDRQLEDGIELCRVKGWPPPEQTDIYTDNDRSASRFARKERAGYARLLAAIEAGTYDRVVMAVEDRTHRQIVELHEFITLCEKHRVTPATVGTEYDLTDEDQKTMWFIKVRFAEAEVEKTSRRVRRARLAEARSGRRHPGGPRAFGEPGRRRVRDEADGPWRTVPILGPAEVAAERALIAEAARRLLAGDSLRALVVDWNQREITGTTGRRWTTQTLRGMLLAPRLAGLRGHLGALYPSADIEPILEAETWEALRALLTDPARRSTAVGATPRHLLSGLLFCGVCGTRLRVYRGRDGERVYRCPDPSRGGRRCVGRQAEPVEQLVTVSLFEAAEGPAWDELAATRPADDPARPHHEALAKLAIDLDTLEGMLAEAALAERQGGRPRPSSAVLGRKLADREAERDRHRAALVRLQRGRTMASVPENLRDAWPDLSLDRRRAILKAVVKLPPEGKGIVVHPQGRGRAFDPGAITADWRA